MANLSSEYEFFAQWLSAVISCSLLLISLVRKVMDVAQHTGHFPFTCAIFNDIIENHRMVIYKGTLEPRCSDQKEGYIIRNLKITAYNVQASTII